MLYGAEYQIENTNPGEDLRGIPDLESTLDTRHSLLYEGVQCAGIVIVPLMVLFISGRWPCFQLFCQVCDSWVLCCPLLPMISFYRFSDLRDEKLGPNVCWCLIQDSTAQLSKIGCPFVRWTLILPAFCLLTSCGPLIL